MARLIGALIAARLGYEESWGEAAFVPLEGPVIVFGPNGAGKTRILETTYLLLADPQGDPNLFAPGQLFRFGSREPSGAVGAAREDVHLLVTELSNADAEGHPDRTLWRQVLSGWRRWTPEGLVDEGDTPWLSALGRQIGSTVAEPSVDQAEAAWTRLLVEGGAAGSVADRQVFASALLSARVIGWHPAAAFVCGSRDLPPDALAAMSRLAAQTSSESDYLLMAARRLTETQHLDWVPLFDPVAPGELPGASFPDAVVVDAQPQRLEEELASAIQVLRQEWFRAGRGSFRTREMNNTEESRYDFFGDSRDVAGVTVYTEADSWLEADPSGRIRVSPDLGRVADALAAEANRLAPTFVQAAGLVGIRLWPPDLWNQYPHRLSIVFRLHEGDVEDFTQLGSGLARWVAASVREAVRRARSWVVQVRNEDDQWLWPMTFAGIDDKDEEWPTSDEVGSALALDETRRLIRRERPALFIIDEPEVHLHPAAVDSVTKWVVDRANEGAGALVATHSIAFLDLPAESATFMLATRRQSGSLERIDADVLGALERHAVTLGMSTGAIIQLVRGVIVVEGTQDEAVINHYFGAQLRAARVMTLPIYGVNEAMSLAELEFLHRLHKPMFLLFDHIKAVKFKKGRIPSGRDTTHEERMLAKLLTLSRGKNLTVLDNPFHDVICALPEDLVKRVLKSRYDAKFESWKKIVEATKEPRYRAVNFKDVFLRELGLKVPAGRVLREILLEAPREPLGGPLHQAVQQVLASLRLPTR